MDTLLSPEEINIVEGKWLMGDEWNDDYAERRMLLEEQERKTKRMMVKWLVKHNAVFFSNLLVLQPVNYQELLKELEEE